MPSQRETKISERKPTIIANDFNDEKETIQHETNKILKYDLSESALTLNWKKGQTSTVVNQDYGEAVHQEYPNKMHRRNMTDDISKMMAEYQLEGSMISAARSVISKRKHQISVNANKIVKYLNVSDLLTMAHEIGQGR